MSVGLLSGYRLRQIAREKQIATDRFRERVRVIVIMLVRVSDWVSVSLVMAEMKEASSPPPLNGG